MMCSAAALAAAAAALPNQMLGMYVLVADDGDKARSLTYEGDKDAPTVGPYNSTSVWQPQLHSYQQHGTNTLFFTFINPSLMPAVPPSFEALAKTRGKASKGAVPAGTSIIFAIGGQAYSHDKQAWDWLTSREKAEAMASEVAHWPSKYGCDGIDLDIEAGIGGQNICYWV